MVEEHLAILDLLGVAADQLPGTSLAPLWSTDAEATEPACSPVFGEVHAGPLEPRQGKMAGEGTLRELKRRRHYMKPSVKKRKKIAEAARRRRKRVRVDDRF